MPCNRVLYQKTSNPVNIGIMGIGVCNDGHSKYNRGVRYTCFAPIISCLVITQYFFNPGLLLSTALKD